MRILAFLPLTACGTLSGARPLPPGQHEVGLTVGGPLLEFGAPVPLPNVIVGARSGLGRIADREVDLGYGTNLTGLGFGIVSGYADLGWLVARQQGGVPALTVRNKLLLTTHALAGDRDFTYAPRSAWVADHIELLASWQVGGTVLHASLGQVFDLADPGLLLVPGLGARIDGGEPGRGLVFSPELRWWGINRRYAQSDTVAWIPGSPGALGVHLGLSVPVGKGTHTSAGGE